MANTYSPFGFSAIGRIPGAPAVDFSRTKRLISKSNTHSIFKGDAVYDLGTGYLDVATTSSGQVFGVADQFEYQSVSQQRVIWSNYYPGADAASDVTVYVITDPYALFLVQSTGTSPVAFTDLGNNINLNAATAGNTTTQYSGMSIDQSTIATTNTLPFRIWQLGSNQYPANDVGVVPNIDDTNPFNLVLVTFNNQVLKNLTGTA